MGRKLILVSLVAGLALVLSGCVFTEVSDDEERSESRQVSDFDAVDFSGFGDLTFVEDDEYSVEVMGPADVVDRVGTEVVDDTLVIEWHERWFSWVFPWSDPKLEIVVTGPQIDAMKVSGAGSVTVDELSSKQFEFDMSGAGSLNGRDLDVDELSVEISGAGSADLSGMARSQEIRISGAGSYDAANLETEDTRVEMSGAGSAVVWAEDTLDIELSGAGSVEYYGDPDVSQDISGVGSVDDRGSR